MKKQVKKLVSYALAAFTALQCMTVGTTVSAAETLPTYSKKSSFDECDGAQGYNGWYYMYKDTSTGEYVNMTWDGDRFNGIFDGNVNTHFIMPGYGTPSVIGFEVPYTGTVTLRVTDDVIYRSFANDTGGDVVATLKLNDDELWTHTFDNTCDNTPGKTSVYVIENVSVKKGDMIYHEVDCGINNTYADIYWKPYVKYTAVSDPDYNKVTEFKMVDDIKASDQQGYNGWHYMYKTDTGYADMGTRTSDDGGKWSEGENWVNFFQVQPAWSRATAIGWQAPYSGTVTLTRTGNFQRLSKGNGDVTATVLLNEDVIKQNDGTDAQWIFGKDENWGDGPNRSYTITGVKVNAGDWIYHVLDCGENNASPNTQWQPMITYTETAPRINGAGTAEDPYIITSITDYKVFADKVNGGATTACAKLASDIVWNSNTPQIESFAGTIDGDGYKVMLRGKSLIKSAADGAVIKNLIVDGAVKGAENVGAFVETTSGTGATITIANSASFAAVNATTDYAAGFVGLVGDSDTINMSNCYGYGTVKSADSGADPFACVGLYVDAVYNNCYYLTGNTTGGDAAITPSMQGVKASTDKTFAAFSGNAVFGYAEKDGNLAVVSYRGGIPNAAVNSQTVVGGEFVRTAFTAAEGADTVKAFVWNSLDGMTPACDAYVLNIQ